MTGQHQVVQDNPNSVPRVSQEARDAFKAIPDMTKEKFVAAVRHYPSVDGSAPVTIAQDMRVAPVAYGFASSAAAADYLIQLEAIK